MSDQLGVTPGPFLGHLPIGEPTTPPEGSIVGWEIFPFEGDLKVKALDRPELPEPAREGESGPDDCEQCARPDESFLWTDSHWRLSGRNGPTAVPSMLLLMPRAHHDLADLPPERAAEIGSMLQRVERAVMSLGGIGRVHVYKWGDGSAHLHIWLVARPEGLMQLRGSCLPLWENVLPKLPEADWREANRRIAAAMAADGGTARV
ncbi:HIT family protein [Kitasatospora sp. NPDC056138]|uniref:HIT family protein n=1 Tax=Kitasatospora sp. NPDC056138 TaxID=3345724 RepID=UPI0035DC1767